MPAPRADDAAFEPLGDPIVADHIRRVVDSAPALSADDLERLRALLSPIRTPATLRRAS